MPKPKEPSEAEIIFNRASLALAKHKQLVASWLPPLSPTELANQKSQAELEKEEEEMFAPVPELLGVGAKQDLVNGLPKHSEASELDKLRKRLLGKGAASNRTPNVAIRGSSSTTTRDVRKTGDVTQEPQDESDDDAGRSAAIGPMSKSTKRKKHSAGRPRHVALAPDSGDVVLDEHADDKLVEGVTSPEPTASLPTRQTKRKPTTFMDELLAVKSRKKGKK